MTTPSGIKRLLERKFEHKESKLKAIVAIDRDIEDKQNEIKKLIEDHRAAFDGLLADGFSSTDLASIGITRHRRLYGENKRKKDSATAKSPENAGQNSDSATYNENTNNDHHNEGS
ncbi:hypothetical protein [Mycobacteroides salmoniphilum]|uniref:Uncharacterized protein n=1 Tax=Mycobacteroides salmoniphilum TaxID=404941 RepID=A0A4R8T026_9MYCO|nr:hypothetical protein [Mycobacteroides salmoniphilum]TEA09235.1 hypothetical protein CCUG60884_00225 [Mycobacteroides salmoniphilum]